MRESNNNRSSMRIILHDFMDCTVHLERLSANEIERARNRTPSRLQHSDHDYSLPSLHVSEESEGSDDDNNHTALVGSPEGSSSESLQPDDSLTDRDETINVTPNPYPEIDFETMNGNDASPASNVEHSNGFVTSNGVNGFKSIITGMNHLNESSYLSGINSHSNSNASQANQAGENDDDDDDLLFLEGLRDELGQKGSTKNCDENGKCWPSIRIFQNVCLKYLLNECLNPYCEFRHDLPTEEMVQNHLNNASKREILEVQNHIILHYDKLMLRFFRTFCMHYGRKWKNYRENLRTIIEPLSTKPMAATYLKDVVDGFLTSGMPFTTCVRQLMLQIDLSLNMDDQFNILWDLIIDARNENIAEQLKHFEPVFSGDAVGVVDAMNKLLQFQVSGELNDLRKFTIDLVQKCRIETFQRINSNVLENFITHMRLVDPNAVKCIEQKASRIHG